jgi:hypothetical protein
MGEPSFMKLGMYVMAPDPMSVAYFINPSCEYPTVIAWQQLSKNPHVIASLVMTFLF